MRKFVAVCLLTVFIGWGSLAYAADSTNDCNCKTGGLGIKISRFVCGFGVKTFNANPECAKAMGVGVVLGSETCGVMLGFGFDQGLLGIGLTFMGPEQKTMAGFSIGYDYSDCRMVWPYEE